MPRGTSVYDEARLQGRLWNPLNDTKIKLWFDPSQITTNAGAVTTLSDVITGAQLKQNNIANQPGITTLNGMTALAMSSSRQLAGNTVIIPQPLSIILSFITGPSAQNSQYTALVDGSSRSGGDSDIRSVIYPHRSDRNNQPAIYAGNGSLVTTSPNVLPNSSPFIQCATFNGTQSSNIFNGILTSNISLSTGGVISGITLGHTDSNQSFVGTLLDVIVTQSIDQYTLNKYQGWLAWRWNLIASVPAISGFKNRPPLIGD